MPRYQCTSSDYKKRRTKHLHLKGPEGKPPTTVGHRRAENMSKNEEKNLCFPAILCLIFSVTVIVLYSFANVNYNTISTDLSDALDSSSIELESSPNKVLIVTRARSGSTFLFDAISDVIFSDIASTDKLMLFEPDHGTAVANYSCVEDNCSTAHLKRLHLVNHIFNCDSTNVYLGFQLWTNCNKYNLFSNYSQSECKSELLKKCKNAKVIIIKSIDFDGQFIADLRSLHSSLRVVTLTRNPLSVIHSTVVNFESNPLIVANRVCIDFYQNTVLQLMQQSYNDYNRIVLYESLIANFSVEMHRLFPFMRYSKQNRSLLNLNDSIAAFENTHFVHNCNNQTQNHYSTVRCGQQLNTNKTTQLMSDTDPSVLNMCHDYMSTFGYI